MKKTLLLSLMFILFPLVAHAATCPAGQFLQDGSCVDCIYDLSLISPVYCPGDDMRHSCPNTNPDYYALVGYHLNNPDPDSIEWAFGDGVWYTNTQSHVNSTLCRARNYFVDDNGNMFLNEGAYKEDIDAYWSGVKNYFVSGNGYYLSNYQFSSWEDWYAGFKPCTNAPANAHYTGPGTPDSADGTIVDANDCPWVCDDGYYDDNGTCTLCPAGTYWNDGVCDACPAGYYCPGNGATEECPMQISQSALQPAEIEWYENKYGGHTASYYFTSYIMAPYDDTDCYLDIVLQHDNGKQYFRQRYNHRTGHYDNMSTWDCGDGLWGKPSTGYYLSDNPSNCKLGYSRNIYQCTNKPEYSYYTGPGTTDVGNCPWACDTGYGRTDAGTCEKLCTAGITTFNSSTGMRLNVYAAPGTEHALRVMVGDTICYVNSATGYGTNTMHIDYNGTVYHLIN